MLQAMAAEQAAAGASALPAANAGDAVRALVLGLLPGALTHFICAGGLQGSHFQAECSPTCCV
jgi:hypothetical protein